MVEEENKSPSLFDRVITAILAPIVFNFCVIITIAFWYSFLPKKSIYFFNPFNKLYFLPGKFLLAFSILLPVIAGFLLGMIKFANLIGLLFPFDNEDNPRYSKTIIAWIILLAYAYIYAKILS